MAKHYTITINVAYDEATIPDEKHIILNYRDDLFRVRQLHYRDHIVSVLQDENEIEWIIDQDLTVANSGH